MRNVQVMKTTAITIPVAVVPAIDIVTQFLRFCFIVLSRFGNLCEFFEVEGAVRVLVESIKYLKCLLATDIQACTPQHRVQLALRDGARACRTSRDRSHASSQCCLRSRPKAGRTVGIDGVEGHLELLALREALPLLDGQERGYRR